MKEVKAVRAKVEAKGEDLCLSPVPLPQCGNQTGMTATVSLTALSEQQQAQFDAAVEDLLAHLVPRHVEHERAEHGFEQQV